MIEKAYQLLSLVESHQMVFLWLPKTCLYVELNHRVFSPSIIFDVFPYPDSILGVPSGTSLTIKQSGFKEYSNFCSQTASNLEVINHRAQRNRNFNQPRGNGPAASRQAGHRDPNRGGNNREKTPNAPNTGAAAEREKLLREGRCFKCGEQGHISRDCVVKNEPEVQNLEGKETDDMNESEKDVA